MKAGSVNAMAKAGARARRIARATGTVRFRITGLATLAVLVVLVATGFVLLSAQRRVLTETVDEGITGNVDHIEGLVLAENLPPTLTGLGEDDTVAQVVAADGQVLRSSPNLEARSPIAAAPNADDADRIQTVRGVSADDDADDADAFRLLSRRVDGPDGAVVIHVAATLDDIDESVATLTASLLVAVPAVVLLLAVLVWWLVGRTLGPVEAIRAEVADIGGTDLHRRVPVPVHDDEIGRLAHTMNDMLGRVEHAARRQQGFVADASHELRSPLTRIRAALEVDLAHPDGADTEATQRSVLEETVGLQRLVDDLLQLARSDAGPVPPGDLRPAGPVDLDDLVLRLARRVPAEGRVAVDATGVTAAQVHGRADQLARAVGNIVDNAARHAASRVTITLHEEGQHAVLGIGDDGPGIPPEHYERVFERFTRLDDARSTATGGTGLGLAIARDVVRRHGGTIVVDPGPRTGARFVVTLPLSSFPGKGSGAGGAAASERVVEQQHDHGPDDRGDEPRRAEGIVAVEDQPPEQPTDVGPDDSDGEGHPEGHRIVAGDEQPSQVPGHHPDDEQANEETNQRATS